jgi:DNA-binding NarL/FixJ family response regulator
MPGETILVVDDDESLRTGLKKTLMRAGYRVLDARNPDEALEILGENRVDLAILDITMPTWASEASEVAGIELLEEIKGRYPETQAIMLTGKDDVEKAVEAMRLGACNYLLKDRIRTQSLLKAVQEALESECTPPGESLPNIGAIRSLLRDAFSAVELKRFCQDRPLFRSIIDLFGPNSGLEDRVAVVIDYCETRKLFSELLSEVQEYNRAQFDRHQPYYA